ncbi:hypothetical protein AURDEDRAFT_163620 [Auricularia subglabra TFB-10046 SS5]|nr:hypothetical protein AURDEDRAFT_163620 [Auricularia subglabra TFB-10046 SS5]
MSQMRYCFHSSDSQESSNSDFGGVTGCLSKYSMADCLGTSVMIIAMPHGSLGNAYTWHSDQIEVDAPELPQAIRDLWFQQLAGARRQHVTEMASALEALRAEQKATREQLIELNRENDKLKKRLDKTTAKLLREREARL